METRVLIRSYQKPNAVNPPPPWCSWWNLIMMASWFQRYSCLKVWTDGRTDGRTLARVPYYKLTLSLRLWWAKNALMTGCVPICNVNSVTIMKIACFTNLLHSNTERSVSSAVYMYVYTAANVKQIYFNIFCPLKKPCHYVHKSASILLKCPLRYCHSNMQICINS